MYNSKKEKDQQISEIKKDLSKLKKFEIDYNETFVKRFKEMEENIEYYSKLYGPPKKKFVRKNIEIQD